MAVNEIGKSTGVLNAELFDPSWNTV